jgi:hypothetical protein
MRLAVMMGGEFRHFPLCYETWKAGLPAFDLFLSTWSTSNLFSDNYDFRVQHLNKTFPVTPELVKSVTGELKFLNIEEPIPFDHRGNNQIYHWHKLLTTLIRLQDNYDYVILTRPDATLTHPANLLAAIEEASDKLYGASYICVTPPPLPHVVTVSDWVFLSSPKTLIKHLLPVPYMQTCTNVEMIMAGLGPNMHTHLAYYFVENAIYVHQCPGVDIEHRIPQS